MIILCEEKRPTDLSEQVDLATRGSTLQYPTTNDSNTWRAYWHAMDQPWRTEPEIDEQRQRFLRSCLRTVPRDNSEIYPFMCVQLTRADIEWMLANPLYDVSKVIDNMRRMFEEKREFGFQAIVDFRKELNYILEIGQYIDLRGAELSQVNLSGLQLDHARLDAANLQAANLEGTFLLGAHLEKADLGNAKLESAILSQAHMEGAQLQEAHLESADLRNVHLEDANLNSAYVAGTFLIGAFFSNTTSLNGISLSDPVHGSVLLDNVHWGNVDLSGVDWTHLKILGDEQLARHSSKKWNTKLLPKHQNRGIYKEIHARQYQQAARANRMLALTLQEQGLAEEASQFAYRAQLLLRIALRKRRKIRSYLFSLFLDAISGYGYKIGRSFLTYACIISIFSAIYYFLGSHLAWYEAVVISMTAFHGRGFFPAAFSPGDPFAFAAAFEAFVGLIIEVTFIATLTQRLFRK